jgi:hypothetical protein
MGMLAHSTSAPAVPAAFLLADQATFAAVERPECLVGRNGRHQLHEIPKDPWILLAS